MITLEIIELFHKDVGVKKFKGIFCTREVLDLSKRYLYSDQYNQHA